MTTLHRIMDAICHALAISGLWRWDGIPDPSAPNRWSTESGEGASSEMQDARAVDKKVIEDAPESDRDNRPDFSPGWSQAIHDHYGSTGRVPYWKREGQQGEGATRR